jgi:hypothetical protein
MRDGQLTRTAPGGHQHWQHGYLPTVSRSQEDFDAPAAPEQRTDFGGRNTLYNNFLDGSIFNNLFGLTAHAGGQIPYGEPRCY